MRIPTSRRFVLLLIALAAAACGSGTLKITSIQLGKSLNTDGSVGNFMTTFDPHDTVYISIVTAGAGDATLGVRWKFAGRVIGEPSKKVSYKDVAATEFHLQGADGLPAGDYIAEVVMDGQAVGTRPFKVQQKGSESDAFRPNLKR